MVEPRRAKPQSTRLPTSVRARKLEHSPAEKSTDNSSPPANMSTPIPCRSPKRLKRSHSPESTYHTPITGSGAQTPYTLPADPADPDLQFAYEDDAPARTPEELRSSDEGEDGDEENGSKILERPRELDYVCLMTLRGHKRGVAQARYSPDGRWIASCSADATIKVWHAATGALAQTLEGHLAGISTIAWSPDSRVLASGSDDKLIRLWDVASGKALPNPLVGHHNYVYSLAFSPKGNMLVSGSYDEAVFLWDVRTTRLMRSLPAHSDPVSGVDFVRDGTLVCSCSSDGLIRIWDTGTGQCLKTLVHEDNAPVTGVRFSPNGRFVLAATLDSSLRLWNYVDGSVAKTYQGHKNEKFSIGVCFGTYAAMEEGEEGKGAERRRWAFAACGGEDGTATLWDVSSKDVLQVLRGHEGVVLGVDFSPSDGSVVTCGVDKTVKIWRRRSAANKTLDQPATLMNGHVEIAQDAQMAASMDGAGPNGVHAEVNTPMPDVTDHPEPGEQEVRAQDLNG